MPGSRLASTEHSPLAPVLGFQGCRGVAGLGCQAAATSPLHSSVFGKGSSHQRGQRLASTSKAQGRTSTEQELNGGQKTAAAAVTYLLLPLLRGLVLKQPCPAADLTCLLQGLGALSQRQALALSPLLCNYEYGQLVTRSREGPESWQTF